MYKRKYHLKKFIDDPMCTQIELEGRLFVHSIRVFTFGADRILVGVNRRQKVWQRLEIRKISFGSGCARWTVHPDALTKANLNSRCGFTLPTLS